MAFATSHYIYSGRTGKFIASVLCTVRRISGKQIVSNFKRVIAYLRQAGPDVEIHLRDGLYLCFPELRRCVPRRMCIMSLYKPAIPGCYFWHPALDGPSQNAVCRVQDLRLTGLIVFHYRPERSVGTLTTGWSPT